MDQLKLDAKKRESIGTLSSRKWRQQAMVPGIVYGGEKGQSLAVAVDGKTLSKVLSTEHGMNVLLDLNVEGKSEGLVVVREVQHDPVSQDIIHVDLIRINLTQNMTATIPVHLKGEDKSLGIKSGGVLQHDLWEVEVECRPDAIPDFIEVDVSGMDIGDTIHVRDLAVPAGVELLAEADQSVIHIAPPRKAEEPAAAETEAPAAPEVIKKAEKAEKEEKK